MNPPLHKKVKYDLHKAIGDAKEKFQNNLELNLIKWMAGNCGKAWIHHGLQAKIRMISVKGLPTFTT